MKYLTKTILAAAALIAAVLPILMAGSQVSAAGTATMYLSPSSKSMVPGDSLDVEIHVDSGTDTINAVQANLSYSPSLTFSGITDSNDFGVDAQCSSSNLSSCGSGGNLTIARGTGGGLTVSGDKIVATVHFTASAAGTASINFASSSVVVSSTATHQNILVSTTGGTYTIVPSAKLTLSPALKTVAQGANFDVQVYEDSGSTVVNGVQANLKYDTSRLSYVRSAGNTAVWPVEAQNTESNGVVQIGRGTQPGTPGVTGNQLVATVTFKATAAGTANVIYFDGSEIAAAGVPLPSNNSGGAYTITAVTSNPPSGGGSSGGGSASTGSTKPSTSAPSIPKSYTSTVVATPGAVPTSITTPADNVGPTISDIKITNVTANSATISWTTSEPATSEVDYGLNTNFILSKSDATLTTAHSLSLDPKELVGGKTYHFVIKSTDAAGNLSASEDMTFSTGGLQITKTQAAVAGGAVVVGAGVWAAAAGAFKFGGMGAIAAHGTYKAPKPIIVGGGSPPPPPPPPPPAPQSAPVAPAQPAAQKPAPADAQDAQSPGKVIGPKQPPK